MGTSWNRFDLIRLVLASVVFVYHAVALATVQPGGEFERILGLLAELSIQGFFIASGALVYGSYQRSNGVFDYAVKRVRRLYPAYAVIILVPVVLAAFLVIGTPGQLVDVLRYAGANLVFLNFLEPNLPGWFEGQRFTEVNGALWTLKIEVMFYLTLPVLAWGLSKLGRFWWVGVAVLVLSAFAWKHGVLASDLPYQDQLARQLPGQMMFFAAGMALWRLWDWARVNALQLFVVGAVSLTLAISVPALDALRVLGLTGLIAGVAFAPGPKLNAAAWGDVSYGVYITHFPIIQGLIAVGAFETLGFAGGLTIAALLVFGSSYLLWWWVEKPALRRDSHYRQVSVMTPSFDARDRAYR